MDRSACDGLQSEYQNAKPHTNNITRVTRVLDPQLIMIVSRALQGGCLLGDSLSCACTLVVEILASLARACLMYYHLCPMPCPATMLVGIAAAALARKQGTPATTRGTFEGKTRSDGTNPLRRACWACRNLKWDAPDLTYGKARCGSSRFRVGLVGIHVCSRGRHSAQHIQV